MKRGFRGLILSALAILASLDGSTCSYTRTQAVGSIKLFSPSSSRVVAPPYRRQHLSSTSCRSCVASWDWPSTSTNLVR